MSELIYQSIHTGAKIDEAVSKVPTLEERINTLETQTTGVVNVMSFGAKGDGFTDDTVAIQSAIDSISSGIVFFPPKIFITQGIIPKNNISLLGYGATLKLPITPTNHLIYYNNIVQLTNFNIEGITFDGVVIGAYDLVHIDEPTPGAPKKTWYMSTVKYCTFKNAKRGIYCPVPGSVKITGCDIRYNDIGMEWNQEHFYITDTVFWTNRIGINSPIGNHFSCVNSVFAHHDEYGIVWSGFESSILGSSFIDNVLGGISGDFYNSRIVGNRIIQCGKGIYSGGVRNIITGNEIANGKDARNITDLTTVIGIDVANDSNNVSDNLIYNYYNNIVVRKRYNVVSNNVLSASIDSAIVLDGVPTNNIITNNNILSSLIGIELKNVSVSDCTISNNSIKTCKQEGIKVNATSLTGAKIDDNHISDNGTDADNTYSGITVLCNVSAVSISKNIIRNGTSGKMKYGIEFLIGKTASDTLIANNITRNLKSVHGYVLPSAGITQSANIGTVTTPV